MTNDPAVVRLREFCSIRNKTHFFSFSYCKEPDNSFSNISRYFFFKRIGTLIERDASCAVILEEQDCFCLKIWHDSRVFTINVASLPYADFFAPPRRIVEEIHCETMDDAITTLETLLCL